MGTINTLFRRIEKLAVEKDFLQDTVKNLRLDLRDSEASREEYKLEARRVPELEARLDQSRADLMQEQDHSRHLSSEVIRLQGTIALLSARLADLGGDPSVEPSAEEVVEQACNSHTTSKIDAIRVVRERLGVGLKDAKDMVERHWDLRVEKTIAGIDDPDEQVRLVAGAFGVTCEWAASWIKQYQERKPAMKGETLADLIKRRIGSL